VCQRPPNTLAKSVRKDVIVDEPISRGVNVSGTTLGGTWAIKEAGELRSEMKLRDEGDAAIFPMMSSTVRQLVCLLYNRPIEYEIMYLNFS
jgi:hypothetical protein